MYTFSNSPNYDKGRDSDEIKTRAIAIYKQAVELGGRFRWKDLADRLSQAKETRAIQMLEDLRLIRTSRGAGGNIYHVELEVDPSNCIELARAESPLWRGCKVGGPSNA